MQKERANGCHVIYSYNKTHCLQFIDRKIQSGNMRHVSTSERK